MNIEKLENNLQSIAQNRSEETFIYDLLLAYEQPKAAITRLKKGDYNLSKKPDEILAELESAHDRFPGSPEIALSLARGYERISGNNTSAIVLYERFIQLAPNHPLCNEAEASINRLR